MVHTTCAALHCLSSSYTDTDLKFHQFPHDAQRRKIWITACKRSDMIDKDWDFFKHKHVCSLHFEKCMYGKKDRLKKSAIPSLHLSEKPLQHDSSTQTVESIQHIKQRSENDVSISYIMPNVENTSTTTYTQNEGPLPNDINQVNIKEEIITPTKIEQDVETKTKNNDDDENSDSVTRVPILFEEDVGMKIELFKSEILPTQSLQSDDLEIVKDGATLSTQARNPVQEIDHCLTATNVYRTSTNPINTTMMPILKRKMDGSNQTDKVIVLSQNAAGSEGSINPEERRCKRNDYVVITRPQSDRACGKFLSTKLNEASSSDGSLKAGAAECVEMTAAERGGVVILNVAEAGTLSEKPLQHDSSSQTVESIQYDNQQSENYVSIKYVMSNVEKSSTTTYIQTEDSLQYDINHVNIKEEIKTENDDDENSDSEAFEEDVEMKIEIVEHKIPLVQSTQSLQSDDLEIMKDCGTLSNHARNLVQEIDQGFTATNVNSTSTNRINNAMRPILKEKMDGSIQTDRVIVLSRNDDGSERSINPEECTCDRNDYMDMTRQQFYRACSKFLSANFAINVQRQMHIDAAIEQGGHELCEAGSSGRVEAGAVECVELNAAGCGGVVLPDVVIAGPETGDSAEADLYAVDPVEASAAASTADCARRSAPAPRPSLPPPQMEVVVESVALRPEVSPPSPPPLSTAFSVPSPALYVDYDIVHRWAWCRLHNVELAPNPALECPRPRQNLHDEEIFEQLSSPPQMEDVVEGVALRPEVPPPSPPPLSGESSVPSPALYVDYDMVHRWAWCQLNIAESAPNPAIECPAPTQNLHDEDVFEQLYYGSEADSAESDDEDFLPFIFPRAQRSVLDTPMDADDDAELDPGPGPAAAAVPAEYATARTSSSSILDVPLTATDQPWSLYHFDWKPFPNAPIPAESRREMFSQIDVGPTTPCVDPYDIFVAIWDRQFMEYIASETNRYAQEVAAGMLGTNNLHPNSRHSKWRETTADEMYVYFGLVIAMGVVVKSRVEEYWNATPDVFYTPGFGAHMSSSRFAILSKCLHFTNNQDMCALELDDSEAQLFKVQPVLSHLNNKFSSMYRLRQNIVLDESLLQWKGWLDISQFIPNKAATVGIKTYEICEPQTGYLWRFEIHSQRSPPQQSEDPMKQYTPAIVLKLTHGLEGKGHTLWMDSFYNSPCLARRLKALGFDCVGTLRTDREFVPQALHSLNKGNMRPGQISGLTSGDVDVMVWRDNNRVSMISTYHGNAVAQIRDATKPILIHDYNIMMGGVDKKDQMLAMYPIERKQTKVWYKKLFRRLLNVSILNSYIIHRQSFAASSFSSSPPPPPPLTHRNFRIALVKSLLSKHYSSTLQPATSQILHQNKHIDVTHRLAKYPFGTHNNKRQRRRRKCINCSKLVHTFCVGCNKTICIDTCFLALHT